MSIGRPALDLTGQRFGRFVVGQKAAPTGYYLCRCDCGNEKIVRGSHLSRGATQSCGCFRKEAVSKAKFKHGEGRSAEYRSWQSMLDRCRNPRCPAYERYGGRGITVCDRWLGEQGYLNFLNDMGRMPVRGLTLERKDNSLGYEPENCVWATRTAQANNRRSNHLVQYDGRTMTLAQAARFAVVRYSVFLKRVRGLKWPIEKALTTPLRGATGG